MKEINVSFWNESGVKAYNEFKRLLSNSGNVRSESLYKCKARVVQGYGTIILYSYDTPIAIVDVQSMNACAQSTATRPPLVVIFKKFKKWLRENNPELYDNLTFYSVR